MRHSRPLALAGAAALVAVLGVAAYAEAPKVHVLHVALPDGSVRTVRYTGDVPPRLVLVRAPVAPVVESSLAGLDRMAAMMDMQAAAMMRQVSALTARPTAAAGDMQLAALANAPAGARYSYTTTTIVDGHACTTSVVATSLGGGKQPQLLRRVSGDGCGTAMAHPAGPAPTALPVPPTPPRIVSPPTTPKAPPPPRAPAADTI